jgi:hypothetical protein
MDTFIGLDLGQLTDYTAAVPIRRSLAIGPTGLPDRDSRGRLAYRFDVAAIRRYPLGTSYTSIIAHVVEQLKRPDFGGRPRLVVDGTGVGVAVVEMFRAALRPMADRVECYSVTITAGRAVTPVHRYDWHVAKIQLVGSIRAALESQRLKVPPGLEHAATLKRELQDFKVKITDAQNETFQAREGAHDDLVLATALPIWLSGLPFLEMDVDPDGGGPLRPGERSAVAREVEEMERAEREAILLEQGRETHEMHLRRLERERRIAADPFADEWWEAMA